MTLRSIDGESYVSLVDIDRNNENVSFLLLASKHQYHVCEYLSLKASEFDCLIEILHHLNHNNWENFQWESEDGSLTFALFQDVYSDFYFSVKICVGHLSATLCIKIDALQLDEFINGSFCDNTENLSDCNLRDEDITMQIDSLVVDKSEDLWEIHYDISGKSFGIKEKLLLSIEFDMYPLLESLSNLLKHEIPLQCQFNTTSYKFEISPSHDKENFDIVLDFSSSNDMDALSFHGCLKCDEVVRLYTDISC